MKKIYKIAIIEHSLGMRFDAIAHICAEKKNQTYRFFFFFVLHVQSYRDILVRANYSPPCAKLLLINLDAKTEKQQN